MDDESATAKEIEIKLLLAYYAGEEAAFNKLHAMFFAYSVNAIKARFKFYQCPFTEQVIEDVVLALWFTIAKTRGTPQEFKPGNFLAWFHHLLNCQVVNFIRKNKKHHVNESLDALINESGDSHISFLQDCARSVEATVVDSAALEQFIATRSLEKRKVILLLLDLYKNNNIVNKGEVARLLDVSRQRLSNIIANIRSEWEAYCNELESK